MSKVVTFGEIMMRLSPPHFLRFSQTNSFDVIYGGGESNVAVSLANFGVPTQFVTRMPDNDMGRCALIELRKRNVGTHHIVYGGERLGIYFLETGAVSRGSKVVYDRAHSAMSTIESGMIDWEQVFEEADWFHWTGITPAISQGAADACKSDKRSMPMDEYHSNRGVTASEENLRAWFDAGSELCWDGIKTYEEILFRHQDYQGLEKHVRNILDTITSIRKNS